MLTAPSSHGSKQTAVSTVSDRWPVGHQRDLLKPSKLLTDVDLYRSLMVTLDGDFDVMKRGKGNATQCNHHIYVPFGKQMHAIELQHTKKIKKLTVLVSFSSNRSAALNRLIEQVLNDDTSFCAFKATSSEPLKNRSRATVACNVRTPCHTSVQQSLPLRCQSRGNQRSEKQPNVAIESYTNGAPA